MSIEMNATVTGVARVAGTRIVTITFDTQVGDVAQESFNLPNNDLQLDQRVFITIDNP